jgi:hypothetical protein
MSDFRSEDSEKLSDQLVACGEGWPMEAVMTALTFTLARTIHAMIGDGPGLAQAIAIIGKQVREGVEMLNQETKR